MRKAWCLLALALSLVSCQKPHEKAVSDYIEMNFNDPKSYELIELGTPQQYTTVTYCMEQVRAKGKAEGWSADSIFNKTMEVRPYLIEQGCDPDKVMYRFVEHTYRANNENGAKILHKERWYLNEDLSSVINIEPL